MRDITISRRTLRISVALAIGLLLAFAMFAPRALSMLVAGTALAIVLSYPLERMEQVMRRGQALILLLCVVLVLLAITVSLVVPSVVLQITTLVNDLPRLAADSDARLSKFLHDLADRGLISGNPDDVLRDVHDSLLADLGSVGSTIASRGSAALQAVAGLMLQVLGSIFIAVYLLVDAPKFRALFLRATPQSFRADSGDLWDAGARSLSRYFLSLLVIALLQAAIAFAFLSLLGVPYSLVFALWIGLASTIPYIGTWIGGLPPIAVAALQSPKVALVVFGCFFAMTTVVGNLITPRLQGHAIRVHPVIVLLSVVAAGEWFGVMGMFLAVPVLAVGRVVFDFLSPRLRLPE
ncbi:MAG: AI-2E family transporter [Dehalococcoidia bacterium]|nr:MAG: AI-2E family transporter [Dehalococcoidia bacterium]